MEAPKQKPDEAAKTIAAGLEKDLAEEIAVFGNESGSVHEADEKKQASDGDKSNKTKRSKLEKMLEADLPNDLEEYIDQKNRDKSIECLKKIRTLSNMDFWQQKAFADIRNNKSFEKGIMLEFKNLWFNLAEAKSILIREEWIMGYDNQKQTLQDLAAFIKKLHNLAKDLTEELQKPAPMPASEMAKKFGFEFPEDKKEGTSEDQVLTQEEVDDLLRRAAGPDEGKEREFSPEEEKEYKKYLKEANKFWMRLDEKVDWNDKNFKYKKEERLQMLVLQTRVYVRSLIKENSKIFKGNAEEIAERIMDQVK